MTKQARQKYTRHAKRSLDLLVGLILFTTAYTMTQDAISFMVLMMGGTYNTISGLDKWVNYINNRISRENRA